MRTSGLAQRPPLALKRPPSEIKPEVEGSRPFSFPILVQPVLDKNCVACHEPNTYGVPDQAKAVATALAGPLSDDFKVDGNHVKKR